MANKYDDILISVLMPVFKPNIDYLKVAVDSMLQQTHSNIELIFLYEPMPEDGAQEYFDSLVKAGETRTRVLVAPPKSGLPYSLNMGLDEAKGKYIARMDADDFAVIDRFEKQLTYMEEHEEIAVLGGMIEVLDETTYQDGVLSATGKGTFLFMEPIDPMVRGVRMMFVNAGVVHPGAFYRKSFFDEKHLRYSTKNRGSEDYRLWGDVCIAGGLIASLPDRILYYRMHEGQASQTLSKDMILWDNQVRWKQLDRYGDFSEKEKDMLAQLHEYGLKYSATDYYELFEKIKAGNRKKQLYPDDVMEMELCFRWMIKALSQLKREKDFSMLKPKYIKRVLKHKNLAFVKAGFKQIQLEKSVMPR